MDAVRKGGLLVACERALVAGARARGAGTRQQIRAAARRFVRRHRHDAGYLAWVLRSVAASSALAVALLGLGAEPALAKATLFAALTGASSPLDGADVGLASAPALGDLDADGDLDLVSGDRFFGFHYFENLGDATAAFFVERFDANNPLDGQDIGSFATPALGDLDADGDLDLVAGEIDGGFFYFENTGSASSPAFAPRIGAQNPFSPFNVGADSRPAFADLDGDGDLDLVSGETYGGFFYFENTGSATSPAFEERTGDAHPLDFEDVGYYSAPAFADLDGDGDLDLVAGNGYGNLLYFENTGSPIFAKMEPRPHASNPLDGHSTGLDASPALGDLDADGDLDVVAGKLSGEFGVFENRQGRLWEVTGAASPFDGVGMPAGQPALAFGDVDGDGDSDFFAGEQLGTFLYFENSGSATNPAYVERSSSNNPMDGRDVGADAAPALGDLDGDGDLDLIAGSGAGTFFYFANVGSPNTPVFIPQTGASNPLNGVDVGVASTPSLGDVDADGDLDVLTGNASNVVLLENTGSPTAPAFSTVSTLVLSDLVTPALGDVDGDGDLDLVAGSSSFVFSFSYFENTGSPTSFALTLRNDAPFPIPLLYQGLVPTLADVDGDGDLDLVTSAFQSFRFFENAIVEPSLTAFEQIGAANPLVGHDIGFLSAPALGDLDRDGDLDLVAAEEYASARYFENTGNVAAPFFVPRTGAENPFEGEQIGFEAGPALGDLDADGDLDLVTGADYGTFFYFENTGSATDPAFVAVTGVQNPLAGHDVGFTAKPALGDLDADGDLDLVAGERFGTFAWLENTGSATSPVFVARTGAANPLDGHDVGDHAAPSLGDVDADGDLDLVAGSFYGTFAYFENTGSVTSPVFVQRTGAVNPFDGKDVGVVSTPALGDLDGDGDLDLVSGENYGIFRTFYLPEPAHGLLLSAGLALLGLLERLRGRRARTLGRGPIHSLGRIERFHRPPDT